MLENGQPEVQTWATFDSAAGTLVPNPSIPEAEGFPEIGAPAVASEILVADSTILFVADDDADLTSFETFPAGVTLRFRATAALTAAGGGALEEPLLASSTVGQDFATPELLFAPPPASQPLTPTRPGPCSLQSACRPTSGAMSPHRWTAWRPTSW